jgi:hypothetical protein
MPDTLDLHAVRRFTDDLNDRLRRCDNGEGIICNTLEESINHYVQMCRELRAYINAWARSIFTKQVPFDPEVEKVLKEEVRHLLKRAKEVAARGRAMDGYCFILQGLNLLHCHIADFDYLLENWVSPQPAIAPAPRVQWTKAAEREISERLQTLPPLPSDWQPTNPEQLAVFRKLKAE